MTLSHAQLENIGFNFVLEEMRCASAYGRAALRGVRPYAPGQEDALRHEWENIEKTLRCRGDFEREYARLEHLFMQVKDIRASIRRCEDGVLSEVELFEVKRYLLQLAEITPLFFAVDEAAGYHNITFVPLPDALELLDPEGTRVASFHLSARYSAELAAIRREKKALEERLEPCADGPEKAALTEERRALVAREQAEEEQVRAALSDALRPFVAPMLQNADAIARLDVTLQKARLAAQRGGVMPTLAAGRIAFAQMRNPMVADALEAAGKAFTPVDIALAPGATVITGANMGGKSVALKTLALNVYLSLCGFYAFADAAALPVLGALYLVNDDLEDTRRGLSSFGGEIVRFNEILAALDESVAPALILLDEFARGTNPREGAAIAQSVCESLNARADFSVLTTHFDHVARYAGAHYEVAGLKNADIPALAQKLSALPLKDRVAMIGREMDYGLWPVTQEAALPHDALNICRLLGLSTVIIDKIEAKLLTFDGE